MYASKKGLAAARLFFHEPKFAILDECTSGVSALMEKRLYETCERRGITCITISHRPVLEQYHDVVLNILADGKGGWEWRETKRGIAKRLGQSKVLKEQETGEKELGGYNAAYANAPSEGAAVLERRLQKERSAKYLENEGKTRPMPTASTMQRLQDVLKRFAPMGASLKDQENQRILLLAGMIVSKTVLADAIARYDGYIVSTVLKSDWWVFIKAVAAGAFFRTFLAFFDAQILKHKWFLNLEWRRRLTEYLMNIYLSGNIFYDIKNRDSRIKDPDERIAEQVEQLSIAVTDLWTALLKPAFDIMFNTVMLYRALGASGVGFVLFFLSLFLCLFSHVHFF